MRARSRRAWHDGVCGQQDVPTAYRYLILNKDGYVLDDRPRGHATRGRDGNGRAALAADPGTVEIEGGGSGLTYAAFPLKGGGACALSASTRRSGSRATSPDCFPNPQNLMLVGAAAEARARARARGAPCEPRDLAQDGAARGGGGARRRGRARLSRSAAPMREVNDVLAAMDAMRTSLAESLEARWAAGGAARQVASLAHDLKTPLTVLRANADFVAEELEDGKTPTSRGRRARHSRQCRKARRLRAPAHRGLARVRRGGEGPMRPAELCEQVLAEAAQTPGREA